MEKITGINGDDLLNFFNLLTHIISSIPFHTFDGSGHQV
jgi:hypothetical protein